MQIFAGRTEPHVWRTDPGDATVYGLAPTYGCCTGASSASNIFFSLPSFLEPRRTTARPRQSPPSPSYPLRPPPAHPTANFGQGWPKFAASALGHNGSAVFVALYVPATATFPASVGGGATVRVATRYPFGDDVELDVSGVTAPAGVTLMLRIPAWPGAATVWSSSASPSPPSPSSRPAARPRRGTWHAVACPPPGCRVLLRLSSKVTLSPAGDPAGGGGVAVHRGPLLFALPLEEAWTLLRADPAQPRAADWQVSTPSDWALALVLNLAAPAGGGVGALGHDMVLEHAEDEDEGGGSWGGYAAGAAAGGPPLEPASPFAASRPRVWLRARARAVDAWRSPDGGRTAGPLPASPVCAPPPNATTGGGDGCGPERTVRLVPFGNTRLRVAVLPYTLRTG